MNGQKKLTLMFSLLLFYCGQSFSQTNLIGKWVDVDHANKKIEIYIANNGKIYGKSEKNFTVLKDFVYEPKSNNYVGVLVNPDNNEEFNITIKQPSINRLTFVVKKFFFSKKFTFKKEVDN
jgi:hypothetical protein